MKKTTFVLLLATLGIFAGQAQNTLFSSKKLYKTWITLQGEKNRQKGVLFETRDSSILLSDAFGKSDYADGNYTLEQFSVESIRTISLRKQNAIGTGALIGGSSGAGLGALIGLTSTNTAEEPNANAGLTVMSAIVSSVFLGTIGAAIGAAIGTSTTTLHIHGSQEKFENKRTKLNNRSLAYDPSRMESGFPAFKYLRDTVVDFDGNVYRTVALGAMVFIAENLKVKHFRSGKEIPCITDSAGWSSSLAPAWCDYMNDPVVGGQFGLLYNGFVIADSAGICPVGWHIPSADEWNSLVMCLGGHDHAGGYMKEEGTAHWSAPNKTMLTDNTFALPGGSRNMNGVFSSRGRICQWWAFMDPETGILRGLSLGNETTGATLITPGKNSGLSVRCIRNE